MAQKLYTREGAYIPRIAAVHDLCGYGKCSLGVAIPVLSAAGCDVCPVPTGLFSSHTAFPGWYMHDTTSILKVYTNAWKGIGVEIDAVYSGFLGDPEQVTRIRDLYETYPKALRVVDPVMADHGKVYPTYTPELCQAMAELANGADILTPNLTEASIIHVIGQIFVALHAGNIQIFHTDGRRLVLAGEIVGNLMYMVMATIGYTFMQSGYTAFHHSELAASLFLPCKATAQKFKLPLLLLCFVCRLVSLAVAQHGEVFEPGINAQSLIGVYRCQWRQRFARVNKDADTINA